MRCVLALLLVFGCGGPTQQQLAETPTAKTRPVATEAPPASQSDKDRERLIQQFDDMQATKQAYREAEAPAPPVNQPSQKAPGKKAQKAPVEQAPTEPKQQAPGETPQR